MNLSDLKLITKALTTQPTRYLKVAYSYFNLKTGQQFDKVQSAQYVLTKPVEYDADYEYAMQRKTEQTIFERLEIKPVEE